APRGRARARGAGGDCAAHRGARAVRGRRPVPSRAPARRSGATCGGRRGHHDRHQQRRGQRPDAPARPRAHRAAMAGRRRRHHPHDLPSAYVAQAGGRGRRDPEGHGGMTRDELGTRALARAAFAQSIARGLGDPPRWLPCRYLYDAEGSGLFEDITRQPEYYLTRTEDALLAAHASRLRARAGAPTLVELGSGSSTKTRHLLRAWTAGGQRARYVPVDISRDMLDASCRMLEGDFPSLEVRALAGTYEQAFARLCEFSPLVLVFLGSSLGNFDRSETAAFLERVADGLSAGDHLLLGLDLVKDPAVLEAAYNDAAGVSAAFTRNLFARMNRQLGTRLDLDAIQHVAYWNE